MTIVKYYQPDFRFRVQILRSSIISRKRESLNDEHKPKKNSRNNCLHSVGSYDNSGLFMDFVPEISALILTIEALLFIALGAFVVAYHLKKDLPGPLMDNPKFLPEHMTPDKVSGEVVCRGTGRRFYCGHFS